MRIFGSSRNSKASTNRATNVATNVASVEQAAGMRAESADELAERSEIELARVRALEVTDEMPIVSQDDGDSDVFVCRHDAHASPNDRDDGEDGAHASLLATASATARAATDAELGVTLFVYGWESVEPGPLSWAFPSLRAALDAVKTMRNAVEWCIVAGSEWVSVDAARAKGAVLIEQNA